MQKKWISISALLITGTLFAGSYQVVFETTSCTGDSGFASVAVENVYKVENGDCFAPGSKKKLKKILVRNGKGSFDTFTLTAEEAKSVISDLKDYQRAKLKNLENAHTLIIGE
jgi:hypothetical protein